MVFIMIKAYIFTFMFVFATNAIAEKNIYIKVKNTSIGSYFILFNDSLYGNERVGLVGQSYFKDKGIFVINNGFKDGVKRFEILLKSKKSGDIEMVKELVFDDEVISCDNLVFYNWLVECGIYSK